MLLNVEVAIIAVVFIFLLIKQANEARKVSDDLMEQFRKVNESLQKTTDSIRRTGDSISMEMERLSGPAKPFIL